MATSGAKVKSATEKKKYKQPVRNTAYDNINTVGSNNPFIFLTNEKKKDILEKYKNIIYDIKQDSVIEDSNKTSRINLNVSVDPESSNEDRKKMCEGIYDMLGFSLEGVQQKCGFDRKKMIINSDPAKNEEIIKITDYIADSDGNGVSPGKEREITTIFTINEKKDIASMINYINTGVVGEQYTSSDRNSAYFMDFTDFVSVTPLDPSEDEFNSESLYKNLIEKNREEIGAKLNSKIALPGFMLKELDDPDCQSGYAVIYNKSTVNEAVRLEMTQRIILYIFYSLNNDIKNNLIKPSDVNAIKKFLASLFAFPVPDTKCNNEFAERFSSDESISELVNSSAAMLTSVYENIGCIVRDEKQKNKIPNPIAAITNFKPYLKNYNDFVSKHEDQLNTIYI